MLIVLEEIASEALEIAGDSMIALELSLDGTMFFSPMEDYLPAVIDYLENPNDLTEIYQGNNKFSDLALKTHNHDGVYAPIGTGGSGDSYLEDYLEVVNQGETDEYLRCKIPLAGDKEIQAFSDNGQLPPDIWESLPVATPSTLGVIKVGTNLTIDGNGVLNAAAGEGEGGSGAWGGITGDIAEQSDLQAEFDTKSDTDHTHPAPATLVTANFSILQESGYLVIKYGSTVIMSISSAGKITALNEVEAFGTPIPVS